MEQLLMLAGRNTKIYIRDKGAVFFSFLSALIVICLMVFFLGDMNIDSIVDILGIFSGKEYAENKANAELLVLAWTCAGIISINAVTVSLAVYSGMIKDRVNGRLNAIYTAPISRLRISLGYIVSAWGASVFMCIVTLALTEIYGVIQGMEVYTFVTHIKLVAMIMMNSFVYAALMYPLSMLAKTEGAWSGFGTVVGTLVGFLGGIYIPIGTLSDGIARVMKCTPIIYGTSMFRTIMTEEILGETFQGVPEEIVEEYRNAMGIRLTVADYTLTIRDEWLILFGCGIIFLVIGMCMLKYSKKADR
ncbi:MAG: ABC transporter permease [Lachnospiraceae bacterium]|nr:ABC transporter permease [Lachnospiraceae bacterium]